MPEELDKKFERPITPEKSPDQSQEQELTPEKEISFDKKQEGENVSTEDVGLSGEGEIGAVPIGGTAQQVSREKIEKIENILARDLDDIYLGLEEEQQKTFKVEGEKTAREISGLLEKAKVNTAKIIDLIKNWLKMIPGVNKFFIEQEAKIRGDEIINMNK